MPRLGKCTAWYGGLKISRLGLVRSIESKKECFVWYSGMVFSRSSLVRSMRAVKLSSLGNHIGPLFSWSLHDVS